MTVNTPQSNPTDLGELVAELRKDESLLPPAPWELWTSCSYRRIKRREGYTTKEVLFAYNQRGDNHPDLSMPEDQLSALVRLRNSLPTLLSALATLQAERDALKAQLSDARGTDRIGTHSAGCADWGPRHYECLKAERDALKADVRYANETIYELGTRATSAEVEVAALKAKLERAAEALGPFAIAYELNSLDGECLTLNDAKAMHEAPFISDFRRAAKAFAELTQGGGDDR